MLQRWEGLFAQDLLKFRHRLVSMSSRGPSRPNRLATTWVPGRRASLPEASSAETHSSAIRPMKPPPKINCLINAMEGYT